MTREEAYYWFLSIWDEKKEAGEIPHPVFLIRLLRLKPPQEERPEVPFGSAFAALQMRIPNDKTRARNLRRALSNMRRFEATLED